MSLSNASQYSKSGTSYFKGLGFTFIAAWLYAFTLCTLRFYQPASQDSLYHFAVAQKMATGVLAPELSVQLPFSILTDLPVDHYFGYHALLSVFAFLFPGIWGLKLATATLFAAVPASIDTFIWRRGAPYPWI